MNESSKYPSLHGRTVLVTGANSGIGFACVRELILQGCKVAAGDIETRALIEFGSTLTNENTKRLLVDQLDVTDASAVSEWVLSVMNRTGQIHSLVASAGIEPEDDSSVHDLPDAVWARTLGVNLTGMFNTCKHVVKAMLSHGSNGSVVIIGSPTGHFGMEVGHHAYSASKGGVFGLGRVMANEYAPQGIRVNIVWPGLIETPINDFLLREPTALAKEVAMIPQKRMGQPQEIANMVKFLLSDDASYCSGGIFVVDGGLTSV